jgi:hypothetical protein
MNQIATVLAAGPMKWQQIQVGVEQNFQWVHGTVLIGILNAMVRRGLIVQDGEFYGLL